jgi:hypothetical protein
MLCNTSRTGLPAECHVFTIEPVFPSLAAELCVQQHSVLVGVPRSYSQHTYDRTNEDCKKKVMITVKVKKEITEKYESGIRVADIVRFYNKSTSTICTLLKKK